MVETVERDVAQPFMFFFKDKGLAAPAKRCAVAIENHVDDIAQADLDFPFRCVQDRADA